MTNSKLSTGPWHSPNNPSNMPLVYKRLTKPSQVLKIWSFFHQGLTEIAKRNGEAYIEDTLKKAICYDVAEHHRAFVAIGFLDGRPAGFGVFEEATPLFAPFRSFITRVFYHRTGNTEVSVGLMKFFETWAKDTGVKFHLMSTKRPSGSAIRLFTGPKYGFKVSSTLFEKEL